MNFITFRPECGVCKRPLSRLICATAPRGIRHKMKYGNFCKGLLRLIYSASRRFVAGGVLIGSGLRLLYGAGKKSVDIRVRFTYLKQ